MSQENMLKLANYKKQLAELERQYWFNDLPNIEYIVRHDLLTKNINELEELND